ncbi:hypothetical protein [Aureibacter tunicatorum]|uniref:Uncharacterized protein n=1 Tax=Aureibacter tunicatorum TaxID=866807 RepID=A0AAE3XMN3_9BACT|nr:hypothetical protein [Aureibacter tunicatorum]MDR6239388.1 hypothetical protein [Aureibacter tunicatorum]BDD04689.1 hypothetical protein AUTU_21720 [Aureibacter tunicatorum]
MENNNPQLDLFLDFSEKLTAFDDYTLNGTGQVEEYYFHINQIIGDDIMKKLLDQFQSIKDQADFEQSLRAEILSCELLGPVTRNIIKLWFTGTWYQLPKKWMEKYSINDLDKTYVISSRSYVEGLMWPTIGTHPMGAKGPGYGTWTEAPNIPTIKD